ncbi:CHASE2 domain-containing protein [Geminicoccus harenae]|uniref:CHASE2 domain-containing protein n=3 Tax=Geminicoccus harenae TaxID=2498453 RepID=UPI001C9790C7|nr:CHASE2 domain-containing protein [Geminicoccus harenae]
MQRVRPGCGQGIEIGPLVLLLAIAVLVMAGVVALRTAGALRPAELVGHDVIVTLARQVTERPDPGVVVLGVDDRAKADLGWPLADATVARIIEILAAAEPAAIGLDFFRGDMPVGPLGQAADPADTERLVALMERTPNLALVLDTFAKELPPRLASLAEMDRLVSPNLVPDPDDVVRRGILGDVFPDPEVAEPVLGIWSLAARLAQLATAGEALAPDGAVPEEVLPIGRRAVAPLRAEDGPYAGAESVGGGYEFLASWPVTDLPVLRITDLLAGRLPPDALRDKVVLVGSTARSVGDIVTSPLLDRASETALPGRSLFGVEAHAQLTAQLLLEARGQVPPFRPAPPWAWLVVTGLACLLGAAAGGLIAAPALSLPALLLGALAWPAIALYGFVQGIWLAWVPPLLGWLGAAGLGFVLVAWRERRQRARLTGLFRTYLPPSVADTLWAGRDRLLKEGRPVPQTMVATVLFSDVRGFTAVSERMTPAELLDWLEAFHTLMADCIAEEGGIVADFMGDGMMAAFGVPVPRTDAAGEAADARAAVAAALKIRRRLPDLSGKLVASGRPGIAIRIGIHTGPLVAGAIGGRARLQYTILGDTVNTAARLESWAGPGADGDGDHCRILISATTLHHLDEHCHARPVGSLTLKGKAQPVPVFRVTDEVGDPLGV